MDLSVGGLSVEVQVPVVSVAGMTGVPAVSRCTRVWDRVWLRTVCSEMYWPSTVHAPSVRQRECACAASVFPPGGRP
jgi:hypothetical protein